MPYTYKSNHVEEGLSRLISQFRDKKNITKLVTTYLRKIQELEDVAADMHLKIYSIDNAENAQLDMIGVLVGEPRAGRTDVAYRDALKIRIKLNSSNGTREELIDLAVSVAGTPITVTMVESQPATFEMFIDGDIDPLLVDTNKMSYYISQGRGGGIKGLLTFHVAGSFQYDGSGSVGYDDGKYGTTLSS